MQLRLEKKCEQDGRAFKGDSSNQKVLAVHKFQKL